MLPNPSTSDAVYAAIPTIPANGQLHFSIAAQLLEMEMREHEGGMSSMELRLSNFGSFPGGLAGVVFDDGKVLQLGTVLKVYAGNVKSPTAIFEGKVMGLEARYPRGGPPELVVLAEDALQTARMRRRSKTWEATSLDDIVRQIASQLGLTPQVTGLDATLGTEQQFNETDLHFLRRLLARYDADVRVVENELHACRRIQAQSNAIELERDGELREVRVLADLAHQVTQVTTSGWDYRQGQKISATSQSNSFGPGSGAHWLAQAFSNQTRSEQLGQFANLGPAEAQALVDAEFSQRSRRFVVAHGVAEGNAELRVGSWLTLKGLGPFSNTYYTTAAVHRYDLARGYETEFTAECAYLGAAA